MYELTDTWPVNSAAWESIFFKEAGTRASSLEVELSLTGAGFAGRLWLSVCGMFRMYGNLPYKASCRRQRNDILLSFNLFRNFRPLPNATRIPPNRFGTVAVQRVIREARKEHRTREAGPLVFRVSKEAAVHR